MAFVYVIRHPESAGNAEGRLQGWTDTDLSDLGLQQLERVRLRFEPVPFTRIYTSPLRRARLVAEALAKDKGLTPILDEHLMETSFGEWSMLPISEANRLYGPERTRIRGDARVGPPGGESAVQVWDRTRLVWERIRQEGDGDAVVVSHAGAMAALLGAAFNMPRDTPWGGYPFRFSNCGVSVVELRDPPPGSNWPSMWVHRLNDICHVEDLIRER